MKEPTYYWFAEFKVVEKAYDKPAKLIGYFTLNRFNKLRPILEEEGLTELEKQKEKVLLCRALNLLQHHEKLPDLSTNPTKEQFDTWQREVIVKEEYKVVNVAKRNESWEERWIGVEGRVTMTRYYPCY